MNGKWKRILKIIIILVLGYVLLSSEYQTDCGCDNHTSNTHQWNAIEQTDMN